MGDSAIRWFSTIRSDEELLVGGKAARLGSLFNARFSVPQGFVVTTAAFVSFIQTAQLEDKIRTLLRGITTKDSSALHDRASEIQHLILQAPMPPALESSILEAYDNFNIDLAGFKDSPGALAILKSAREPIFVSVRSSVPEENVAHASFAGQYDSFVNVKGTTDVILAIKKVFASLFSARALHYRARHGYELFATTAVIVQRMINAEKSGTLFSKHPTTNARRILIESVWGLGQGLSMGRIKPDSHELTYDLAVATEHIAQKRHAVVRNASGQTKTIELKEAVSHERVLQTHEQKTLAEYALKVAAHFDTHQKIAFALEDHEVFILEAQPIADIEGEVSPEHLEGHKIAQGIGASAGVASGVVRIIRSMSDFDRVKEGDVLVLTTAMSDVAIILEKSAGLITLEGGVSSAVAAIARESGVPAVVGAQHALDVLQEGMEVTLDGVSGMIFDGMTQRRDVTIEQITPTSTDVTLMLDLPQFAQQAAQSGASGVGIVMLEGIIKEHEHHPLYYLHEGKLAAYTTLIYNGLKTIAEQFPRKPFFVRASDIVSDTCLNLLGAPEKPEKNPLLGLHGLRFLLTHEDIFRAELRAVRELAQKGHTCGILLPHVVDTEEVRRARAIFESEGCSGLVAFGIIIETPAACVIIKDLLDCGVDAVLIGTAMLTQHTLAIDASDDVTQALYDPLHWAILKQISRVIRMCKEKQVPVSIYGPIVREPAMISFLLQQGIDAVTVRAEHAARVSQQIAALERGEEVQTQNEAQASVQSSTPDAQTVMVATAATSTVRIEEISAEAQSTQTSDLIPGDAQYGTSGYEEHINEEDDEDDETTDEVDETTDEADHDEDEAFERVINPDATMIIEEETDTILDEDEGAASENEAQLIEDIEAAHDADEDDVLSEILESDEVDRDKEQSY